MAFSAHNARPHIDRPHVLIVEDELVARGAMEALLRDSGFCTMAAASGEEALELAENGDEKLIALIDLDLPGMDGAELLRHLWKERPGMHAVIMTASSSEHVARQFGHDVLLLRKPLDFKQVLKLLSSNPQ